MVSGTVVSLEKCAEFEFSLTGRHEFSSAKYLAVEVAFRIEESRRVT